MPTGYTHHNLSDIPDSAPDLGASDFQESRFATPELGSAEIGFTHHRYKPGQRQGFGHRHTHAEEFYVVIAGSGRVKLGDDVIDVGRLDAFRVAPQTLRAWEGGPEGLEVLSFGARNEGDAERIPSDAEIEMGWWTD